MDWISILGWTGFLAVALIAVVFFVVSLVEREPRAAAVTAGVSIPLLGLFGLILALDGPFRTWIILGGLGLFLIGFFSLILRKTPNSPIQVPGPQVKIDERDALFHRFHRIAPGTPEFTAYYKKNPEKLAFDDKVREMPMMAEPGSRTYDPLSSPMQVACFEFTAGIGADLEWSPEPMTGTPIKATAVQFTRRIKGFARYLGAASVGCTALNPAYVYSHIGRSPGTWGAPISLDHPNAIALSVEMCHDMLCHAPDAAATTETAFKYAEVGKVAMILAKYINLLGYEARAHIDANYRVMCVPIAADAGLGELGRLGLLITPDHGPRIRLAVVTTDLPLVYDNPTPFGVQDFCTFCKKCADICPSGSVDKGDKALHAGAMKWQTKMDTCYRYWRIAGSDCALCVKVCPYAHPKNPVHDAVRWMIQRNHSIRRLALWGDDLAYGRRPNREYPLPDWHDTAL
ncbi:MAG: reductive dehalogenase domain-containing protein [Myxococcota bacterium]|nr:reductive dehalogenase domain-containing protein [Myxococcota bacterium]